MGRPSKVIVLAGVESDRDTLDRCQFVLKTRCYRVFVAVTEEELATVLTDWPVEVVVAWQPGIVAQTRAVSPMTRVMEMGAPRESTAEAICPQGPFGAQWIEILTALAMRRRGPRPERSAAPGRSLPRRLA
ncbi:MAG TPA: hypothetical protein VGG42_18850 [Acidobacteriaceae bacterium]|jgi:hypothetical protein